MCRVFFFLSSHPETTKCFLRTFFAAFSATVGLGSAEDICSPASCTSGEANGRCRFDKGSGTGYHCSDVSSSTGQCPQDTIDISMQSECMNVEPEIAVDNGDITIKTVADLTILASKGKTLKVISKIEAMDSATENVTKWPHPF